MNLEEIAASLQDRRRQIQAELRQLTAPPDSSATVSFGKRVGDGTTEAVERIATTSTARSLTATLAGIERALAKIDGGSYGICDDCGERIAPARLAARPAASLCVACSRAR